MQGIKMVKITDAPELKMRVACLILPAVICSKTAYRRFIS